MNQITGLQELMIQAASSRRMSLASYKRAQRALKALGFTNEEDRTTIFVFMQYYDSRTRAPYPWLANALAPKQPAPPGEGLGDKK